MLRVSQAAPLVGGQSARNPGKSTPEASKRDADSQELDDSFAEEVSKEVFAAYVCRSQSRGLDHPGDIAEAASLAVIPLPACRFPLFDALPATIVEGGKLSKLQLEGKLDVCKCLNLCSQHSLQGEYG